MIQQKQKSLFWIISTIYLTMGFSGSVLAAVFVFVGKMIVSGTPHIIGLLVLFLLQLAGYLFGLRIGVNFAHNRAFIKQEYIFKISAIVATIPILFLFIFGWVGGFELIDVIAIFQCLAIFCSSKYFLEKKLKI